MTEEQSGQRMLWSDLCADPEFQGRWIALDEVRYEGGSAVEGLVVDVDTDRASLCARVQRADQCSCAILFCDDKASGIRRAPQLTSHTAS